MFAPAPPLAELATPVDRSSTVRFGVGLDTSRYGHCAAFLRDDLKPAAPILTFAESAAGYAAFRAQLERLAARHPQVTFVIRLDAAGQYADNVLHFLGQLANHPGFENVGLSLSCGDPQRNKNYRAALFGQKKSDPLEAVAAARYALTEKPKGVPPTTREMRMLRQVAGRLQAAVRQRTRLVNQLHHLLALGFPELALVVKDITPGWVLELVHRYPTAKKLATASVRDLESIPYLPHRHINTLLSHAGSSIASLDGQTMEELVRDQVRQLRDIQARQKRLETLLVDAYRRLPTSNHLDSIPGIGAVTAAVLTAFISDIGRFETPGKLVAYFGVLPIEVSSGVDREGQPRGPKRYVMSRRGNDLVRRYLWMAALSAVRFNPAVRALYRRVVAKHPDHKAIAIGHAMRKLLHLTFAIWKTGKPFDSRHHPWDGPAPIPIELTPVGSQAKDEQGAGHTPDAPVEKVVTAPRSLGTVTLPRTTTAGQQVFVDFAHVKRQLSMAYVLDQLGLLSRLRGSGSQRRGPCPIHRGDARGRTFSVHLEQGVFCCFDEACSQQGDVIDLWAAVNGLSLRDAALDLIHTFGLEPVPQSHEL